LSAVPVSNFFNNQESSIMKNVHQRIASAFIALTMLVLAGCASSGMTKTSSSGDGDKLFAAPAVRVDRLVTKTSELEGTIYELDAVQIGWKQPGGDWVTYFDKDLKREVTAITRFHREKYTTPFGEKIVVTFVGGVLPAIVNGEYAKQIAKQTSCKPGSICADNVNVNNNDLAAIATGGIGLGGHSSSSSGALAGSNASASAGVTGDGTCSTCGFVPK
jgi:hypothetical protein